jgi:fatty-acyl-CoA synthase
VDPPPDCESDAPSERHNIGHWPGHWARLRGTERAVKDEDRDLSWSEFEDRVARLAGWLLTHGVQPGDRVAILLPNRSAYLEAVFAAARVGGICVPINLRLAPREIAFLLDDCRPAALLHEHDQADVVDRALQRAGHTPALRIVVGGEPDAYESSLSAAPPHHDCVPVTRNDPMMLMYTSGTTGSPKGALLPHRKTLYNCINARGYFAIRAEDRVLVVAPLFHSLGLQILALPLLYCGGALVLQPRFDADRVWRSVVDERISYFGGVPAMHQRLYDALSHMPDAEPAVAGLRFVFTAGSAVSVDLIRAFERRGIVLKQGYGQTESSILTCLEAEDALRKAGSVGRAVANIELRVVGQDSLERGPGAWRDAEVGETGEIVVRGPITMLGYWERPEATAETLVEGWLHTRDLGTRDDEGYITLVGRARDMFISGGENVYPAEIERVYREHPAIREVAVVGVPDERWGEVGRAHVVVEPGAELDLEALDAWASEQLARFKIPHHVVVEPELPHTASGKVQKHKLLEPDAAP